MNEQGKRVGRNEALFREVNERLKELGEGFSLVTEEAEFVCECGDSTCVERIRMSLADYEEIRRVPTWFAVLSGHELLEFEKVVDKKDGYLIVEKLSGGPAGIAIKEDPRS
jgi:hypothetical protein